MLFMLWTFDILFVVVDYFIYLLEPILGRLSNSLSLCQSKAKYSRKWPWLLDGYKYIDISLKGLGVEIEQFYAMRLRYLHEISFTRSSLAQTASESLINRWPWLRIHHAYREPTEMQLDWIGHDVGLVAEWDCCRLSIAWHQLHHNQDETQKLELLARSASGDKLLVRVGSEPSHVLTWQLINLGNCERNEMRAKLVFYYAQLHPEVTRLHNVLAHLLDDLVETPSSHLTKEVPCEASDGDKSQRNHLSRYALLLMIVANLESRKGPEAILSEHLAEFLLNFSQPSLTKRRIVPKPIISKQHLRLELVEEKGEESNDDSRLEVLDPVALAMAQSGKVPINLADLVTQLQSSPVNVVSANITRDFCREKELADKCRILREHLVAELDSGNLTDDTVLSSLLTTSGVKISNYAEPRFTKFLEQKAPFPDPRRAFYNLKQWFSPEKVTDENQARHRKKSGQMNFPWRKVLVNLLYLFIFLLIRDELFRRVIQWRTVLNEQAREDWIQLKHQLFPHGRDQDEFDLSDFFRTNIQPVDVVEKIPEDKLHAKGPTGRTETQPGGIRQTIASNKTPKVDDAYKSEPTVDSGRMDGTNLLAELMQAMMSEAMADGDLDLASFLGEMGIDASNLKDAESNLDATAVDTDQYDSISDDEFDQDDHETLGDDDLRNKHVQFGPLGLKDGVKEEAGKLKPVKVSQPEVEEAISTATTITPSDLSEAAEELDFEEEL